MSVFHFFLLKQPDMGHLEGEVQTECEQIDCQNILKAENRVDEVLDHNDNHGEEEAKWWDNESQFLLDSQQLVEGLSICDEFLQSQSPNREGHENGNDGHVTSKPRLSDYANLGAEDLKKDLEDCQDLVLDPANIELDTPPDFRLSQLEFGSQDSFIAWGGEQGG
ncbi:suppressor of gamma response 1 [Vitis vinifera]|uniref:Suppressor of gamma response 1 n=1 Tax=Vitis vinifera TaxID=29760 RepID=A0A438FYS9_VITVI|nr:suppressor of gamma response 1 [Vitis vinifera]